MNDQLYDSADALMFDRMCQQDWMMDLQREREITSLEALARCKKAGAKPDDLYTLAAEMGLSRQWRQYEAAQP